MNEAWLAHHGIKGQRWGVRRFQNKDGGLTKAGKKRYSKKFGKMLKEIDDQADREVVKKYIEAHNRASGEIERELKKYNDEYDKKLGDKAKKHDFENDEEYNRGAFEILDRINEKYWNDDSVRKARIDSWTKNPKFKEAIALCEKYKMYEWDDEAMNAYSTMGKMHFDVHKWFKEQETRDSKVYSKPKFKKPIGTMVDGPTKFKKPSGAMIDGPTKIKKPSGAISMR